MRNIKEMIAIVQMYIHHRKDIEVNIQIRDMHDIAKLTMAYNIAIELLNENNFKIIQ